MIPQTILSERQPGDGLLFILVGPSGVGKNSLMSPLMTHFPRFRRLPTAATRNPRDGEREGVDHFFVTLETFKDMKARGELLEAQEVHPGSFYGTLKKYTEDALHNGAVLLADIDIIGAIALKQAFPHHVITIFILPPSVEALKDRLIKRDESPEDIDKRLKRVDFEMSKAPDCDYRVVNEDNRLEDTARVIDDIVRREVARRMGDQFGQN